MLLSISAFRSRVVVFILSSVFTNIVINQSPLTADGNNNIYFSALPFSKAWSEKIKRWKWGTRTRTFLVTISIYFLQQMHQQQYLHFQLLLHLQLLIYQMVKVFIFEYDLIKKIVSLCNVNVVFICNIIIGDLHSLPMIVCAFLTISANS